MSKDYWGRPKVIDAKPSKKKKSDGATSTGAAGAAAGTSAASGTPVVHNDLRRLAAEHPERAEEAENLLRRLFGIDGGNRNTRE